MTTARRTPALLACVILCATAVAAQGPPSKPASGSLARTGDRGSGGGDRGRGSQTIEQLVAARNVAGALEAYDEYVAKVKQDDAGLLVPIARALLTAIATAGDQELARDLALERLAAAGDREARRTLEASATGGRSLMPAAMSADISLAHLGDQKAVARLGERLLSPEIRDKSEMAEGLAASGGPKSAYIFVALLKDPDPGTRAVAARALARLGSREAIGPLKEAFATEEGPGRLPVAAALKSLGSDAADETIARMAKSPAADVRLLAAEAYAAAKAPGWRSLVDPLLNDSNPATRLRAAELLIELDPAARALIVQIAQGANPADREEAARMLERKPPYQIPVLRKLLEDSDSFVRTFAAGAILKAARAK